MRRLSEWQVISKYQNKQYYNIDNPPKRMDSSHQQPDIDDIIKALPLKQKVPVLALKKLLDQRQAIDQQQQRKIVETKLKYQKLIQPLLDRASEIIRGGALKEDEVAGVQELMKPNQKEKLAQYMKGKTVPDYWISIFSNSALVDEINEKDQKALKSLVDVQKINDPNDVESIQLKFTFKSNVYFKQTQICRKLTMKNGQALCLDGDPITWKDNECLTHKLKVVKNKKNGQKSTELGAKIKSFFDIFLNCDTKNPQMLDRVANNMCEISNLLMFDSIDYFLGVINDDEESQDEDDQSEEDADAEAEKQ